MARTTECFGAITLFVFEYPDLINGDEQDIQRFGVEKIFTRHGINLFESDILSYASKKFSKGSITNNSFVYDPSETGS